MNSEEMVLAGDKIDLLTGKGEHYKSMIGDVTSTGSLLAVMPSEKGIPVSLDLGQEFMMFYYRNSGRYSARVRAVGFSMNGTLRLVRLEMLSEPKKEQRREFYRLPASLRTVVCQYMEDDPTEYLEKNTGGDETAYTSDISVSGAALKSKTGHDVGEKFLLRVFLNWPNEKAPPIEIYSEVRRVELLPESGILQVGVRFLEPSAAASGTLSKFVLAQQQKRIKRQNFTGGV